MTIDKLIELSLKEDIGTGDITSHSLELENNKSTAYLMAKGEGVLAGLDIAIKVFRYLDPNATFVTYKKDGDVLQSGEDVMKVVGLTTALLSGERVALNFVQRLSGIATMTAKFVKIISPYGVKLLDTRKTTPLLRKHEKYAVRVGGGCNHRFGLYDMVMLKDNHIDVVGSIKKAVVMTKEKNLNYKIEVEVRNLKEFRQAIATPVDRILLDNMSVAQIKKAVALRNEQFSDNAVRYIELEVSGGVTINNIEKYAKTGVDHISTGAITHSAKALDITLLFREK